MSTKRKKKGSVAVAIPLDVMWSKPFRTMSKDAIHALIAEIEAVERGTYVVTLADIARAKAATSNRRRA